MPTADPGARARGARGWERWGRCRPGAVRLAQGAGGGGGGDGGMRAFSVCGCFEMRQRREGKMSVSDFKAQVYSSVNRRIYLGRATWALPVYSSVTDEYTHQIRRLTDEYTW
jgi:hypothetical protein